MHDEAKSYLMEFAWCREIIRSDIYLNLGAVLTIFLVEIQNSASVDDNHLWVVVGDTPSMYLDIHGPKSTKQVLEDYINLAEDWIGNIKDGNSVKDCYPFKAEPILEVAVLLEKRVSFMKNTLINNIQDVGLLI